jgi:hypothetical protein
MSANPEDVPYLKSRQTTNAVFEMSAANRAVFEMSAGRGQRDF